MSWKKWTYVLVTSTLAGCASSGTPSNALSGVKTDDSPPSVTVYATVTQLKSVVMTRLLKKGYRLDDESPSQLIFSKEQNGGMEIMTQALSGNARCPMPRHTLRLSLAPEDSTVFVAGTQVMRVNQGISCTANDIVLDSKKNITEMKQFLVEVKADAEMKHSNTPNT